MFTLYVRIMYVTIAYDNQRRPSPNSRDATLLLSPFLPYPPYSSLPSLPLFTQNTHT